MLSYFKAFKMPAVLQEATQNHYDMEELVNGRIADRGKFKLAQKRYPWRYKYHYRRSAHPAARVEASGEPVVI